MKTFPRRGEIFWVTLDPTVGTEIKKTRPGIIVSNDAANECSSRIIVAPITSQVRTIFPFEAPILLAGKNGKVLLDQIRAIDKKRLGQKIGKADQKELAIIDEALKIALALI